jgi:hypothetical protein
MSCVIVVTAPLSRSSWWSLRAIRTRSDRDETSAAAARYFSICRVEASANASCSSASSEPK